MGVHYSSRTKSSPKKHSTVHSFEHRELAKCISNKRKRSEKAGTKVKRNDSYVPPEAEFLIRVRDNIDNPSAIGLTIWKNVRKAWNEEFNHRKTVSAAQNKYKRYRGRFFNNNPAYPRNIIKYYQDLEKGVFTPDLASEPSTGTLHGQPLLNQYPTRHYTLINVPKREQMIIQWRDNYNDTKGKKLPWHIVAKLCVAAGYKNRAGEAKFSAQAMAKAYDSGASTYYRELPNVVALQEPEFLSIDGEAPVTVDEKSRFLASTQGPSIVWHLPEDSIPVEEGDQVKLNLEAAKSHMLKVQEILKEKPSTTFLIAPKCVSKRTLKRFSDWIDSDRALTIPRLAFNQKKKVLGNVFEVKGIDWDIRGLTELHILAFEFGCADFCDVIIDEIASMIWTEDDGEEYKEEDIKLLNQLGESENMPAIRFWVDVLATLSADENGEAIDWERSDFSERMKHHLMSRSKTKSPNLLVEYSSWDRCLRYHHHGPTKAGYHCHAMKRAAHHQLEQTHKILKLLQVTRDEASANLEAYKSIGLEWAGRSAQAVLDELDDLEKQACNELEMPHTFQEIKQMISNLNETVQERNIGILVSHSDVEESARGELTPEARYPVSSKEVAAIWRDSWLKSAAKKSNGQM
ncbi:hypothetical protein BS50DRAFT_627615 [Corynespora cassiicola Philippines]|uniref:Uncharacterized protein n=1 Tax=Corynespora cassiicola Philippines TaxID=1448308 RepID=A0A2T2P9C9_CORCC|nr:hypothetical protein BS50DRAFT_627615 [Corynespora cassiicola Philippines]